ncbi:hypothetical protein FACS1894199_06780 [Bacteroidia bacterium]|nr:hypothetical protein FACS1894199_06780 [Bacteroidia bacterium]
MKKSPQTQVLFAVVLLFASSNCTQKANTISEKKEKTSFQTANEWRPTIDVRADIAMVYGAGDRPNMSFQERLKTWQDRGYTTHFMTGIAWGGCEDYFSGKWDGKEHLDEGQISGTGDTITHGWRYGPYVVPSLNYIKFFQEEIIKRVIDAGIDAIYLEEPEFWAKSGYSDGFKREWQDYYGFPWRDQALSCENTYLSNKLKYHLYYRALNDVFKYAKEYGKTKGVNVRCYVPTHSLVNYSQWNIISPEASLASSPYVDGYIAQVWTGTARETTFYNGLERERTFENAFLEYGSMESMTRPTGRKTFFLTDPIEDGTIDWEDYKKNYQATFTAQVLYPQIADYEVMPWPDRIYEGLYKTCATCETVEKIPRLYAAQLQVMVNSLNDIPLSDNKVSGSQGIGVLMSNTMMFQRYPNHKGYDDSHFSHFYGQTLPLLKRGVPVSLAHIENTAFPDTWKDLKVLVMSYSNMKPQQPEFHQHIAQWIKDGGVLVYTGKDSDAYQSVMEWWNTNGKQYKAPSLHLFEQLGLNPTPPTGEYPVGKGKVYVLRQEPKDFVLKSANDATYFNIIKKAYETAPNSGKLETKNYLSLERGPYIIASVMDESVSTEPLVLNGLFIDLFDPQLPVIQTKTVKPDHQAYLYNLAKVSENTKPTVLCGGSRISGEVQKSGSYSFVAKGPIDTDNSSRIYLPTQPKGVKVQNVVTEFTWDDASHTCLLQFGNQPDGVKVEIKY